MGGALGRGGSWSFLVRRHGRMHCVVVLVLGTIPKEGEGLLTRQERSRDISRPCA
jgi:hypothetical protein